MNATPSEGSYYGPIGETKQAIFWEKTWMAAGYLTGLGFGIQFVLYCICAKALWSRKQKTPFTYFLLGYISLLSILNCIFTGANAYGLQATYIDNRNYPGGPWGYLQVSSSDAYNVVSEVAYFLNSILADGLLLWRCRIIWVGCMGTKATYFMILPACMLLASLALAVVATIISIMPTAGFFSEIEGKINLSAYTMSLSLNVLLTAMIVGQMWTKRRSFRAVMGHACSNHYSFVSSTFVESAALYSLFSLPLLVTYGMNHPLSQIWMSLNPAAQIIANYLIIYRVAQGRAWTSATLSLSGTDVSHSMTFKPGSTITTPRRSFAVEQDSVDTLNSNVANKHDIGSSIFVNMKGASPI